MAIVLVVGAELKVIDSIETENMPPIDITQVLGLLFARFHPLILDVVPHFAGLAIRDEPVIADARIGISLLAGHAERHIGLDLQCEFFLAGSHLLGEVVERTGFAVLGFVEILLQGRHDYVILFNLKKF